MKTVAYLKTSTETPDIREQKPVILEFAHNERSKEYVCNRPLLVSPAIGSAVH